MRIEENYSDLFGASERLIELQIYDKALDVISLLEIGLKTPIILIGRLIAYNRDSELRVPIVEVLCNYYFFIEGDEDLVLLIDQRYLRCRRLNIRAGVRH